MDTPIFKPVIKPFLDGVSKSFVRYRPLQKVKLRYNFMNESHVFWAIKLEPFKAVFHRNSMLKFARASFIVFGLLICPSCWAQHRSIFSKFDSDFVFNPSFNIKLKQRMVDSAFANVSTAPNFVVIDATDSLTGLTKQVCTAATFIIGGLDRNTGNSKNQQLHSLHFYFNTDSAICNIGFNGYTYTELLAFGKRKNVRALVDYHLKYPQRTVIMFNGRDIEQAMLAHILFNNGIMSTSGDIAGNFMTLYQIK